MAHRYYPLFHREPRYDPGEDPEEYFYRANHQALTDDPSFKSSAGLIEALRPFASGEVQSSMSVLRILMEYMSLAVTAATLWKRVWRTEGIRRGRPLLHWNPHVRPVLNWLQEHYTKIVEGNEDNAEDDDENLEYRDFLYRSQTWRVRWALSKINWAGEFMWLVDRIFKSVIAPSGSTIREDQFAVEYQRWLIAAVTAPEVDPHGIVAAVIESSELDPDQHNWEADYGWQVSFIGDPSERNHGPVDVELVPYGPRNQVRDFTEQISEPPTNSTCTICVEEFGTDVDESSCRRINTCGHMFHWECLDGYTNASHASTICCPNCRVPICDARPRRPRIEQDD
jgi:hypothetical protein